MNVLDVFAVLKYFYQRDNARGENNKSTNECDERFHMIILGYVC